MGSGMLVQRVYHRGCHEILMVDLWDKDAQYISAVAPTTHIMVQRARPGRRPGPRGWRRGRRSPSAASVACSAARPVGCACSTTRSAARSPWLLPTIVGAAVALRAYRRNGRRLARWPGSAGFAVVSGVVFSLAEGTFHSYYTSAARRAIAALGHRRRVDGVAGPAPTGLARPRRERRCSAPPGSS